MCRLLFGLALVLLSFAGNAQRSMNMQELSTWQSLPGRVYNDIWGYAADGREYAIIGSNWGTHFIDITNPASPVEVASFAGTSQNISGYNSSWRDYKVHGHYVYGVADVGAHSLQIFDMSGHPNNITKVYDNTILSSSAHTVTIDNNKLYLVSNRRNSATHAIDIFSLANPTNPTFLATVGLPWFNMMHAIHVRNDTAYCSSGYGGLFILDLTSPTNPSLVSSITNYPGQGYNHSSWTSGDRKTLIFSDEVPSGLPVKVYDITDISNPALITTFSTGTMATPHNTFMIDNYAILSYYMDGVQIWDLANPSTPVRIGYYDTFLDNDSTQQGYNSPTPYNGNWGIYPYLPSGNIIASDKVYGLYVLTPPYAITAAPAPVTGQQMLVFPNPAKGSFRVRLPQTDQPSRITLFNSLGQEVKSMWTSTTETDIRASDLATGVYTLRVHSADRIWTEKVVLN